MLCAATRSAKAVGSVMRTCALNLDKGNPVIRLGSGSYKHPNPEYGRIEEPRLSIVSWERLPPIAEEMSDEVTF